VLTEDSAVIRDVRRKMRAKADGPNANWPAVDDVADLRPRDDRGGKAGCRKYAKLG
jgi:hypothetical protein